MTFNMFNRDEVRELKPLRGRQIDVIPAITEAVRQGHKRIIVQAPTGMGKTVLAAHLMDRSAKKGKRPIFIAPAIALIEQTLESFEAQGIQDIGVIQAQHHRTDWKAQVQIASRDTLVRRRLPEVDFAIVDECHDGRSAFTAILDGEAWKDKIVIGLSATPWSRGLGLHWSKLIVAATIRQMIEDGAPTGLCPFVVHAPADAYEPSDKGMKVVAGEFQESAVYRAMSEPRLVADAVDNWLRGRQVGQHPGDRTFLYGVNRAHAKSLMEAFIAKGVNCGYIDGESPYEERRKTFERYRNREDKVLANVGVLVTGVDQDVRCIIDATMRKSEINWVQAFGRGLRLADGKDLLRFYDHGGNSQRLGLPTDIHHEELDCRKPGEKKEEEDRPAPKPRKCKKCHTMIPPKTKVCPTCGDVAAPAENTVHHEPGELRIIGDSWLGPQKKQPKMKKPDPTPAQKDAYYSQLIWIADDKGRKRGWADHTFREKFGHFPARKQGIHPTPPQSEVLGYVRHLAIKKAKGREKKTEQTTASAEATATTAS